jgi:hypothetical protein
LGSDNEILRETTILHYLELEPKGSEDFASNFFNTANGKRSLTEADADPFRLILRVTGQACQQIRRGARELIASFRALRFEDSDEIHHEALFGDV